MVMFRPVLLLMSESVDLQQQKSELMFVAHFTTKDHIDVLGLGCCLQPC